MESKLTRTILFIATISAAIFAGIQTFSSSGLFSLKKIQYDYINFVRSDDLTGKMSDIFVSIKDGDKITQIKSPFFVDILIKNTGDVDVPKSDFDGYIQFTFNDSKPIRVQQISSSTEALNSSPEIHDNVIRIPPLLLNADDHFTVRVLMDGVPKKIMPHLRFLGMDSEFEKIQEKKKFDRIDYTSIVMVFFAFLMMGRLASIILLDVELHKLDLMLSMFTVYFLGLLLAKQTSYLSGFSMAMEFFALFFPAVVSCFVSLYFSKNTGN